jgi:outer membrane protein
MIRLFFFLFTLTLKNVVTAQHAHLLTLQEGIAMSLSNSAQLKKAKLERQGLEQRLREARSGAYPQINASLGYDFYPALPTQNLPGELFGLGEDTYQAVQFGQPWQMGVSLEARQNLYSESLRRGIPAMNVSRSIYDLLTERTEEEVIFQTAQVFYQTLQTTQLLSAVHANADKLEALERIADLQYKNGYAVPTDVKRIKVARTNLETQRKNLHTTINALQNTLRFLCGVPFDEALELSEDKNHPAADSAKYLQLLAAPENTTEHRLIINQLELNRIQTNSLKGEAYPTFYAYASGQYFTQRGNPNLFSTNGRWFTMGVVGFRMQVPVFDGFRRHRKTGLLKLEAEKLETDRRQLIQAKELEFIQARDQLQTALQNLRTQSENVALAREISDKMLLQYKEGVASLTDLLNAQTAHSEAETNYWQQTYTYKLAVLKLLKAVGSLDDLK